MNRFIASFTKAEQRILVFVLASLGIGYSALQWHESRQSQFSFSIAETNKQMPRMAQPVAPEGMTKTGLVDVNIADDKLLETLPGIGPSMAAAIMRHRENVGAFRTMDDLDKVPGIGPAMMSKLATMVTFGDVAVETVPGGGTETSAHAPTPTPAPTPAPAPMPHAITEHNATFASAPLPNAININTASADELDGLTGVGPALAQRIIDDRLQNGPFATTDDLGRVKGIGPSILRKNTGMLRVK